MCVFRLVLRYFLASRKENLTGVSTGLTGWSKNLDPTGNPTGRSTRLVPVDPTGFISATCIKSLKSLHNRAIRAVVSCYYRDQVNP